jgi:hypothetical protein
MRAFVQRYELSAEAKTSVVTGASAAILLTLAALHRELDAVAESVRDVWSAVNVMARGCC